MQEHDCSRPKAHLAIASTLPPVAMPAAEDMVGHEQCRGEGRERGPNPQRVGQAPQALPHHLRMPRDADNACLPQVHLGLVHCSHLRRQCTEPTSLR